jgi:hypothetical protein
MIRTFAALAALCALTACGIVDPPKPELQRAVDAYYAGEHAGAPDLANPTIADLEICQPLSGLYRCAVIFSTDAGNVPTIVWVVRDPDGWRVQTIVPNQAPHRS